MAESRRPVEEGAERTGIQEAFALRREQAGPAERDARVRAWVRLRSEAESHSALFHTQALAASREAAGGRIGVYATVDNPRRVFEHLGRAYRVETLAEIEALDTLAAAAAETLAAEEAPSEPAPPAAAAVESGGAEYRAALRAYDPRREFVFAVHFEPTVAAPQPATFAAVLAADADARYWRCERVGCGREARGADAAALDAQMPDRCRCERCAGARYCSPACRNAAIRGKQHSCAGGRPPT